MTKPARGSSFRRPARKGDFIEFQADIDILVAATSCPQVAIINDYNPKAMMYQIFEPQ